MWIYAVVCCLVDSEFGKFMFEVNATPVSQAFVFPAGKEIFSKAVLY